MVRIDGCVFDFQNSNGNRCLLASHFHEIQIPADFFRGRNVRSMVGTAGRTCLLVVLNLVETIKIRTLKNSACSRASVLALAVARDVSNSYYKFAKPSCTYKEGINHRLELIGTCWYRCIQSGRQQWRC